MGVLLVNGMCYNNLRRFRVKNFCGDEDLPYYVRMMSRKDVAQVTEIDREAFPTLWSSVNYKHELQNRLAHFIVACDKRKTDEEIAKVEAPSERSFAGRASRVRRLFNLSRFFSNRLSSLHKEYIIGFTSFWIMAGSAHITSISVRKPHRRQGVGELLLISVIELITELNAHLITLEVRASNTAARNLYNKHGFTKTGLRRSYYIDNREDAVLMSSENISAASFQTRFQRLKQAHSRKWGIALSQVAR